MPSPAEQFQIGEPVLYLPEGVRATIDGYVWQDAVGQLPRILLYRLSCGIAVPGTSIARPQS